jgi:hypothetical protein
MNERLSKSGVYQNTSGSTAVGLAQTSHITQVFNASSGYAVAPTTYSYFSNTESAVRSQTAPKQRA